MRSPGTGGPARAGAAADPSASDRARGAIWGQLVGDAACLGGHWIYDQSELAARWPGGPRGYEAPSPGHYHAGKRPGEPTHYGAAALLLLRSVAELGRFDHVDFGRRFVDAFSSPGYRGYTDKAMRGTVQIYAAFGGDARLDAFDFQQGADDFEPATVSRIAPLVVAHRDDPELPSVVDRATLVSQRHPRATAHARAHAAILRELLLGRGLADAIAATGAARATDDEVRTEIAAALARREEDVADVTRAFGQHCRLDQSFPSAVHAAVRHADDFRGAILAVLAAGGDSAGRGAMVGAWLGAALGVGAIPREWRDRLVARADVDADVERIVAPVIGSPVASAGGVRRRAG